MRFLSRLINKVVCKLKIYTNKVYYIGGSDALPPPLSKEEEEELVSKLVDGNNSVRQILIERNKQLLKVLDLLIFLVY